MSSLYLITGFLGAGKTTFLKKILKAFPGKRLHVIVNEFGKEGVDGELLQTVGAVLDEINNGSIFCSCRLDKFEEVLQKTAARNPDVILVEASGLSDPSNVKKIMGQREKFPSVEYKGSICLIDAVNFPKVYETASVVKKQLNVSDMMLINKTDLASAEQIGKIRDMVRQHRPDIPIYETAYGEIEEEWISAMQPAAQPECEEALHKADITLRKYLLHIRDGVSLERLKSFLNMILDDCYRVKGFVRTERGWYLVSCAGNILSAEPYGDEPEKQNVLVVLSGYGLPVKKAIRKAEEWYPEIVESME